MSHYSEKIAKLLNKIGAVCNKPIMLKSEIISPIYIDNRTLIYHPNAWSIVLNGLNDILPECDMLTGVAIGGMPHACALGYKINKPVIWSPGHNFYPFPHIELYNKTTVVIEDHVTTGDSVNRCLDELRKDGVIVNDVLSITSGDNTQVDANLHSLTTINEIIRVME